MCIYIYTYENRGKENLLILQIKLHAEGDEFHYGFKNKDGGEEIIKDFQCVSECFRHHVKLHRHRDDVETDNGGDRQIEVLGRYDVVDKQSRFGIVSVIRRFVHL